MSLFQKIGKSLICQIISEFYDRAFEDPYLIHFFRNSSKENLIKNQTDFAIALLGGPKNYSGVSLPKAHHHLNIKPAHFGRRQVIMAEVLNDLKVEPELAKKWLSLEEKLRPLIVKGDSCDQN